MKSLIYTLLREQRVNWWFIRKTDSLFYRLQGLGHVYYEYSTSLLAANSLKPHYIMLYDLHSLILIQAIDRTFLFVEGSQLFTPPYLVVKHLDVVMGSDRLCGLVVRVSGYRYRGLGFDFRRYQIF